jgi:hypothetical protein
MLFEKRFRCKLNESNYLLRGKIIQYLSISLTIEMQPFFISLSRSFLKIWVYFAIPSRSRDTNDSNGTKGAIYFTPCFTIAVVVDSYQQRG